MTDIQATQTHTPGPWTGRIGIGNTVDLMGDTPPKSIGTVHGRNRDADARLIAAAPDLLDALIRAEGMCDEPAAWLPFVRAAIAKAEGR